MIPHSQKLYLNPWDPETTHGNWLLWVYVDTAATQRHTHSQTPKENSPGLKFTFRSLASDWRVLYGNLILGYHYLNEGHIQQLKDQPGDGIFVLPTSLSWKFTEGGRQMIAAADQ